LPIRHEVYYRLYYIPIILSAFSFGMAGGIVSALLISVIIIPHILIDWGGLMLENLNMLIEILLYNVLGLLTGFLVSSDRRKRRELEKSRIRLEESLVELERRGERLMQVEESLRAHEKLALMGEMAAIMAHEVRNPLGSIQGAAEILSDRVGKDKEAEKYASILIDEVRRLDDVVTGLIDSARQNESVKKPVHVNSVLQDVIYLYSQSAGKKGVSVHEQYEDKVPRVLADEDMLRQVFINVFLNAVEAVSGGGEITVSSSKSPLGVIVSVLDTGRGIPEEETEKLFDVFHTTKEGGTGLGLAISKRIIEEHAGTVEIQSTQGVGTEVLIDLPGWKGV
jgi:signal transduction histidine kinase